MTQEEIFRYNRAVERIRFLRDLPSQSPWNDRWDHVYRERFRLFLRLRPKRICEIGVGLGYHALIMMSACPEAEYIGFDLDVSTHAHRPKGSYRHAEESLKPFKHQIVIADSQKMTELPKSDVIHVDGLHTYEGCLHDIEMARRASPVVIVDDYRNIPDVKKACWEAAKRYPGDQVWEGLDSGFEHNGYWLVNVGN